MKVVDITPALGSQISDVRIDRSGQEEFDEIMRAVRQARYGNAN